LALDQIGGPASQIIVGVRLEAGQQRLRVGRVAVSDRVVIDTIGRNLEGERGAADSQPRRIQQYLTGRKRGRGSRDARAPVGYDAVVHHPKCPEIGEGTAQD